MAIDDESDYGGESLKHVLDKLLEAQITQTGLMRELTGIADSLARSESRESLAEMIAAVTESTRTEMLAALVNSTTPMATAVTPAPPAQTVAQVTGSEHVLNVLGQYDELRAALGRDGAENFYVAATADPTTCPRTLEIRGIAANMADSVTIGEKRPDRFDRPERNTILVTDPPDEVFTGQPQVRLWTGSRLIAIARFIKVLESFSSTN